MRRASFEVNTASKLKLNNAPLKSIKLDRDPIETMLSEVPSDDTIHGMNPKVVKVYPITRTNPTT